MQKIVARNARAFQNGATDFVILVMSDVHSLLANKMKFGAEASIAAGSGRTTEVDTAALSDAELLSCSTVCRCT